MSARLQHRSSSSVPQTARNRGRRPRPSEQRAAGLAGGLGLCHGPLAPCRTLRLRLNGSSQLASCLQSQVHSRCREQPCPRAGYSAAWRNTISIGGRRPESHVLQMLQIPRARILIPAALVCDASQHLSAPTGARSEQPTRLYGSVLFRFRVASQPGPASWPQCQARILLGRKAWHWTRPKFRSDISEWREGKADSCVPLQMLLWARARTCQVRQILYMSEPLPANRLWAEVAAAQRASTVNWASLGQDRTGWALSIHKRVSQPAKDLEDHVVYMVDLTNSSAVAEVVVGIPGIFAAESTGKSRPCCATRRCFHPHAACVGVCCTKPVAVSIPGGMPGSFGDTPYKRPALEVSW